MICNAALLLAALAAGATAPEAAPSSPPQWTSTLTEESTALAFGDVDGDGHLELAFATGRGLPLRLYQYQAGTLVLIWSSTATDASRSLAWADVDLDGDLDLVVGNTGANRLYQNNAGVLTSIWTSTLLSDTTEVSWGDWDGDGDLDLAVGNRGGEPNHVYDNTAGTLTLAWTSVETDNTQAAVWGDWDRDGLADLAVGNYNQPNRIYRSTGGALQLAWTALSAHSTRDLIWADWNDDLTLDLIVGNDTEPNSVWTTLGTKLGPAWTAPITVATTSVARPPREYRQPAWFAAGTGTGEPTYTHLGITDNPTAEINTTNAIAYGDFDGDGDVDLALANGDGEADLIFENVWIFANGWWNSDFGHGGQSLAIADSDCDGDLDFASSGHYSPIASGPVGVPIDIWDNQGDGLDFSIIWTSAESDRTTALAWGDYDGDGDVDLAASNVKAPSYVYQNDGTGNFTIAWTSPNIEDNADIAWGDFDTDGDLDLAVAGSADPIRIYANDGTGTLTPFWASPNPGNANGISWGDWDGDGDLDLAVARSDEDRVFLFDGVAAFTVGWLAPDANSSSDIAFGDYDGDGLMDLAVSGLLDENRVYRNTGGGMTIAWADASQLRSEAVEWVDIDRDGKLDLAFVGELGTTFIARNDGAGGFAKVPTLNFLNIFTGMAWGDLTGDGDLEMIVTTPNDHLSSILIFYPTGPNPMEGLPESSSRPVISTRPGTTQAAFFFSSEERLGSPVVVPYQLFDAESDPVPTLIAEYSPNGGGVWLPATPAPGGGPTTDLASDPFGTPHLFVWDAAADGVVSDDMRFRFEVATQLPSLIGGPTVRGRETAMSPPFRVDSSLPGESIAVLLVVSPPGPVTPGDTLTFTITVRNLTAGALSGIDIIDLIEDPNLSDPGAITNLFCPPPAIGDIDETGPETVVSCTGIDVPAFASVDITYDATIDIPWQPRPEQSPQRVCNGVPSNLGASCAPPAPICVEMAPRIVVPIFTKTADGWDDVDLDGLLEPGEAIRFRIEACSPPGLGLDYDLVISDFMPVGTTLAYDQLTPTKGTILDGFGWFVVDVILLSDDPDPSISCVVITFRTWVADVPIGTEICNVAFTVWVDPVTQTQTGTYSNDDHPAQPTACFTVTGDCDGTGYARINSLKGVKVARRSDADFSWAPEVSVGQYHLNTVDFKTDLDGLGPHRTPPGVGVAQCEAVGNRPACTDTDALVDGVRLRFYRVMAACPSNGLEGPP